MLGTRVIFQRIRYTAEKLDIILKKTDMPSLVFLKFSV